MPFCFFMIRDEALFRTINLAMSCTVYLAQVGSLRGKHQKGRAGEGGGECESKSRKREPSPFPPVTPYFFPQVPSGNCGTVGLVKFAILSVSVGVILE